MRIEELGLQIGDAMQLQIGDSQEQRYPVRFYGYKPNGSIIVSAPKSGENKMIFVRESLLVTLRFVANNVASGFTSRVLATRGQPYPYLHLEIPKEIQTVEVRKGMQVKTDLSVTVLNKTEKSAAVVAHITNLSNNTIQLESKKAFADEESIISVTSSLKIGKIERLITMDCMVTHCKEKPDGNSYVFKADITEIDDEDMMIIQFYIYQELLRNLHII